MHRTQPRLLVTGGHGVLAQAIAERFRSDNWQVDAPGRDELDVARSESVAAWFRHQAPVELLVCAAGSTDDTPLARLDETTWDRTISNNLDGAARCARIVARSMLRVRHGHIVFVSSFSALHPPVGQAAYAAAKAGLLGLAKSLAQELGPANIRVNTILPGFFASPLTAHLSEVRTEEIRAANTLGRCNTPAHVADFLHFLHTRLPHASGQCFGLDSRIA